MSNDDVRWCAMTSRQRSVRVAGAELLFGLCHARAANIAQHMLPVVVRRERDFISFSIIIPLLGWAQGFLSVCPTPRWGWGEFVRIYGWVGFQRPLPPRMEAIVGDFGSALKALVKAFCLW